VDWIRLAQDPMTGSCVCGNEPSGSIKKENLLTG
jgi:hypothetical protein